MQQARWKEWKIDNIEAGEQQVAKTRLRAACLHQCPLPVKQEMFDHSLLNLVMFFFYNVMVCLSELQPDFKFHCLSYLNAFPLEANRLREYCRKFVLSYSLRLSVQNPYIYFQRVPAENSYKINTVNQRFYRMQNTTY